MKKILIYSHDTYGLGNIRRSIAIANYLVHKDPQKNILILSGSPVVHSFRLSKRIDYVKLPCLVRTERNRYASKYLDVHNDKLLRLRSNLIRATIRDFEPDLVLVDKNPRGVANELAEMLDDLQQYDVRPKMVLMLRDILDEPRATKSLWSRENLADIVCQEYDRVLVVGEQRIFDLASAYDFCPTLRDKISYCGYIERHAVNTRTCDDSSVTAPTNDLPLVLVMAGGGQDGYALLKNYLLAKQRYLGKGSHRSIVISGPELSAGKRTKLLAIAEKCSDMQIIEFTNQMEGFVENADVLVCMGGYNTICEAMTYRKKTICVPRKNPVTEQLIRARRFEELGLLTMICPDQLSPQRIAHELEQALSEPEGRSERSLPLNLDGLQNINAHIDDLLIEKRIVRWRSRNTPVIASA